MICEKCERCFNYKVSELGCYGKEKVCEHFQTDDMDEWIVTGVEDGWIEVDKETWEEYLKAKEKIMEEIHNQCVEDRKNVKLVQTKDPFLYCREPFGSFLGDCCYCSHYVDGGGMTEGGWCKLCGIDCGWGFTCKDNDSEWAIKIEF